MSSIDPSIQRNTQEELDPQAKQRSTAVIVNDLWEHMQQLVNQELALLRADVDERTRRAKKDLIEFSMAGALAYAGALAVMAALILLLDMRLDAWLAALLVGLAAIAGGYGMFRHSLKKLSEPDEVVPRRTIDSVETTTHTIKEAMR